MWNRTDILLKQKVADASFLLDWHKELKCQLLSTSHLDILNTKFQQEQVYFSEVICDSYRYAICRIKNYLLVEFDFRVDSLGLLKMKLVGTCITPNFQNNGTHSILILIYLVVHCPPILGYLHICLVYLSLYCSILGAYQRIRGIKLRIVNSRLQIT